MLQHRSPRTRTIQSSISWTDLDGDIDVTDGRNTVVEACYSMMVDYVDDCWAAVEVPFSMEKEHQLTALQIFTR